MCTPFRMPSCILEALKEASSIKEQLEKQKPGKLKASILSTLQGLDLCKADQSPSQEGPQSLGNLATMHSSMIRNPLLGSSLRGHWKKCVGKGNVASLGLESPLPRSFLLAGAACVGWVALL